MKTLIIFITCLLGCLASLSASSEQTYVELRSGPSEAFPVIHVTNQPNQLVPLLRQGDWFLLKHGLKEGWLSIDQLYQMDELAQDQKWKWINSTRPSQIRLGGGFTSDQAFYLGLSYPLRSSRHIYMRFTNGYDSFNTWQQYELGLKEDLYRFNQAWRLMWFAGLGAGVNEAPFSRWSNESAALVSAGVESIWVLDRAFEAGVRLSSSLAFDDDTSTNAALSVFWNLRI